MAWARVPHSLRSKGWDSSPYDVAMCLIRPAAPSDLSDLANMCHLLWPRATADEHARELAPILAGNLPGSMPEIFFLAQHPDGRLAGFIQVDLRSHAVVVIPFALSATLKDGLYNRNFAGRELPRNCSKKPSAGRVRRAVARWRQTPGSTTSTRSQSTARWDLRLLTAASTIASNWCNRTPLLEVTAPSSLWISDPRSSALIHGRPLFFSDHGDPARCRRSRRF